MMAGGLPLDPDAQAFLSAAGITNATITTAIDTLVIQLKAIGVWTKLKAVYPFVGGTATTHKFNLKNPADTNAAFRLSFLGGWTHSANGALPNGTNAYAQNFLIPSTDLTSDNGLGGYVGTNNSPLSANPVIWGQFQGVSQSTLIIAKTNEISVRLNGDLLTTATNPNQRGFYSVQKIGNTSIYKNGVSVLSALSGGVLPSIEVYLGALNQSGVVNFNFAFNNQIRLAFMGDGLDASENANLYTAVQAFQTTLGRQV
jgi:hypothetical protein